MLLVIDLVSIGKIGLIILVIIVMFLWRASVNNQHHINTKAGQFDFDDFITVKFKYDEETQMWSSWVDDDFMVSNKVTAKSKISCLQQLAANLQMQEK